MTFAVQWGRNQVEGASGEEAADTAEVKTSTSFTVSLKFLPYPSASTPPKKLEHLPTPQLRACSERAHAPVIKQLQPGHFCAKVLPSSYGLLEWSFSRKKTERTSAREV